MAEKLSDKQYAIRELTQNHYDFAHLPERLQADPDVAIAAINQDSALHVLYHLPKCLRADPAIARHTAIEMEKVQTQGFIRETLQANFTTAIAQMIDPGKKVSECFPASVEQYRIDQAKKLVPSHARKISPPAVHTAKQSI